MENHRSEWRASYSVSEPPHAILTPLNSPRFEVHAMRREVYGPSDLQRRVGAWTLCALVCALNVVVWASAYEHRDENPACGIAAAIAASYLARALMMLRELRRLRGEFWVLA